MKLKKIQIGDKKVWPFTIPSGIITTQVSSLEKLAREVPELGILTTKSIGPEPRAGNREPILAQYAPCCFVNAVGLTNPGAEKFSKELTQHNFPKDKFLLASIFGKNTKEFVYVAKTLEDQVDGFELNLSCPHAKDYGMQLGQDYEIVYGITREVVKETKKPVFAKLTPNAGNIKEIAKAAFMGGAYGITAINTVGPGLATVDGNIVLTNGVGGLSGAGILPIGLKCVMEIRQAVGEEVPIIGMGGIRTIGNIKEYVKAGANVFGIGSGLAGMTDECIRKYFKEVVSGLRNDSPVNLYFKEINMNYKKVKIIGKTNCADDFKVFRTNTQINAKPGQFVFAWLPGIGEKPFSVMDNQPLTLGIQEVGKFTQAFNKLDRGDSFYFRGPYGKEVDINFGRNQVLVGGGCGIAGIVSIAKRIGRKGTKILLGAKDKNHIPYLKQLRQWGEIYIATEDGSQGIKGMVTDLFPNARPIFTSQFYNCGPKSMIDAVLPFEKKISRPEDIYSSLDYITSCGIGLCGKCADDKGNRTCVEGPFISAE